MRAYHDVLRALEKDPSRRRADRAERQRNRRARIDREAREAEGLGDVSFESLSLTASGASPEDGAAILEAARKSNGDIVEFRARLRAAFGREPVGLEGIGGDE